jgi:hypothetical protein
MVKEKLSVFDPIKEVSTTNVLITEDDKESSESEEEDEIEDRTTISHRAFE